MTTNFKNRNYILQVNPFLFLKQAIGIIECKYIAI
jgi:hypothetical protein